MPPVPVYSLAMLFWQLRASAYWIKLGNCYGSDERVPMLLGHGVDALCWLITVCAWLMVFRHRFIVHATILWFFGLRF